MKGRVEVQRIFGLEGCGGSSEAADKIYGLELDFFRRVCPFRHVGFKPRGRELPPLGNHEFIFTPTSASRRYSIGPHIL